MNKRSKKITVISMIMLFVLYEFSTGGGVVIINSSTYGGQVDIKLTDWVEADLYIQSKKRELWVPFLFSYYSYGYADSIELQICDKRKLVKSVTIKRVTISRNGKEDVVFDCNWNRDLRENIIYNHQQNVGVIETETMTLSDTIVNVFNFHEVCTIIIDGQVLKTDGSKVEFSSSNKFHPTSNFEFLTHYQHWAGC